MDPPWPSPLALLLALVLGSTVTAQPWVNLLQCRGKTCPKFILKAQHETYEERLYVPCKWICTVMQGPTLRQATAAYETLKEYSEKKSRALGVDIAEDTWPALVYEDGGSTGRVEYGMCWLVRPEVPLPESNELPVQVKTFPHTTMFVRSFGGLPSVENGQDNAEKLKEDLTKAGESFNDRIFYGAAYEGLLSLTHHNEVWIPKA